MTPSRSSSQPLHDSPEDVARVQGPSVPSGPHCLYASAPHWLAQVSCRFEGMTQAQPPATQVIVPVQPLPRGSHAPPVSPSSTLPSPSSSQLLQTSAVQAEHELGISAPLESQLRVPVRPQTEQDWVEAPENVHSLQ